MKDGWQKYNSWLENASSPVLRERSREIAAVRACYDALAKGPASKEEMLYLLRFRDPLMAVKHVYLTMQEDVLAEAWVTEGYKLLKLDFEREKAMFHRQEEGTTHVVIPKWVTARKLPDEAKYEIEHFLQYVKKKYGL